MHFYCHQFAFVSSSHSPFCLLPSCHFSQPLSIPSSRHHVTHSTFSTNCLSISATAPLNSSTSRQQSSGLRSFTRRHRTTAPLAFSTSGGRSFSTFRSASFFFKFSISLLTAADEGAESG